MKYRKIILISSILIFFCIIYHCNKYIKGADGNFYFRVKNKLRCGDSKLTTRNVFDGEEIRVAFQGDFFTTEVCLYNIKIKQGRLEIIGKQGKITLLPNNKFIVELRNKNHHFISPILNTADFTITQHGIATLFNTHYGRLCDNVEHELKNKNFTGQERLYYTKQTLKRYTFITLKLKKSTDFKGTANLKFEGNFYNDSSKPQAFFRLFYNP